VQLSVAEKANQRMLLKDYTDFRWSMATKLGNLSCVMSQLNLLDSEGNINMNHYMVDSWNVMGQAGAGRDPVFTDKMRESFMDCYATAQSWPQQALDRSPLHQKYGRHMIFFNCVSKAEMNLCTKYQARQWLEKLYGRLDTSMFADAATDPYEAAAMVMRLKYETATPEEDTVYRFFWGTSDVE
jgi:hypothetical protein